MKTASLSQDRLAELLDRFSECRVAVVGDFFLDKYLEIDPGLDEPSLETGKTAYQVTAIRFSPGAAGTVVCNLAALGAGQLHAVGLTGEDGESFELRQALEQLGCTTRHLHASPERFTPTYLKPRDRTRPGLEGEHSRYDTKNRTPTPKGIEDSVRASLESLLSSVDAVVVMDQVEIENCGVVTKEVRRTVSRIARENPQIIFWADSRRHIRQFRNVIIKPNQFEALSIVPAHPGDAVPLEKLIGESEELRQKTLAPVFVTRGAEGILVCDGVCTLVPGMPIGGAIDPTGAGDSATAGCVLALCAGATPGEAGVIGNLVASLTVQQLATTGTARPDQLRQRLEEWRQSQGEK